MSLASLIKRLQDIMRKDSGVDGDAQRLAQIVWLIFLKVYDYKEEEAELDDDYVPVIPKGYRWRDWAVGTSVKEQMTGPDLLDFVNNKLIPALGGNPITVDVPIDENGNEITDKAKMKFAKGYKQVQKIPFDKTDDRSLLVKDVMGDATNYMKNGYLLRDVVNLFNEVDLEDSGAAHDFNDMISGLNKPMKIKDFPTADELWQRYQKESKFTQEEADVYTYPYYTTSTGKKPRYYQRIAINRAVKAIMSGSKRILIVMATGTGKTYTSFQIVYRFWKTRTFKKILYLADRNILIDQTMRKDFKPFAEAMEKIDNKNINTSKEVFLGLYQQLKTGGRDGEAGHDYYKLLPRDFFDLIIIDECHRGSASKDSNWHDILAYFSSAVQIGMTATPKDGGIQEAILAETDARAEYNAAVSSNDIEGIARAKKAVEKAITKREKAEDECNAAYFGNPIYTYSLKQGIEDGFLAPYKVIGVELNIDKYGYYPPKGMKDVDGNPVEDRLYRQEDFDRKIVVAERRQMVAKRISDFMKTNDMRFAKTIVFCEDIPHCKEMVRLLENENADLVAEDPRYIMQITGDNDVGKAQLDNFIDPSQKYPVIAVTSRLMSTGVDAETCEIVVLDRMIGSMTEFKQIIGRGTRIKQSYECDGEEKSKMYFTILDFRKNYLKFNDPAFDGTPVTVTDVPEGNDFPKPPIKPVDPPPVHPVVPHRVARVNGVDVSIVGEDVQYLDLNGNLVTQNISSCIRNNIITQYPTFEEFRAAWLLANDKARFASELLLGIDWSSGYKTQYGYTVDDFDIIAHMGYDIEPPMSKHQRTHSAAIAKYLEQFDDEKKEVIRLLLDAYAETNFTNLRDVKNIFAQPQFADIGLTPLKAVKQIFGGKDKYFKCLNELENKLYCE